MLSQKRGQTTLFIIIGIVVIAIIILAWQLVKNKPSSEPDSSFSSAADSIKYSIESCNENLAKNSTILLGLQSGRYKAYSYPIEGNDDYYGMGTFYISHYVYGNNNVQFSLGDVEKEFNEYYKDNMLSCLDNFYDFAAKGYKIDPKNLKLNIEFLDESTIFSLDYDVLVSKGTKKKTLSNYKPAEVPLRFKKTFDVATEISSVYSEQGYLPDSKQNTIINNIGNSKVIRLVDLENDRERRYVFYFAVN
ncbi:hypothetical protein J4231_00295 [Candidatus Woesearchaeota archaeon]|nr:hypothetical protein [Candidatus Woesearchaeota archaeon]